MEGGEGPNWDKTILLRERLGGSSFFEEPSRESRNGKFQGRGIIGRDCPINGGVYLGGGEREAVVVDDKTQPELVATYQELLKRRMAKAQKGETFKGNVLGEAFDLTRELLPYSKDIVSEMVRGLPPDQEVPLSSFLKRRGGICRHQALLAAYLLEKLKTDGYVQGQVSVDRNYVPGQGGHAWVRYVNSVGEIFIIDPAQNFIGTIKEAGKDQWFYERPSTKPIDKLKKRFLKKK